MSSSNADPSPARRVSENTPSDVRAPSQPDVRADVCVVGSGIVGLTNALALTKRGLSVALVDQPTAKQLASFKVGESLLIFSNAFLRVLGDLDDEFEKSFAKHGFWMAYGLEGAHDFGESVSEWAFESELPDHWITNLADPAFARVMFGDCQIVRPEIEAALRQRCRDTPGITFVEGLMRDVELGADGADHTVAWSSRDQERSGRVRARWLLDCSGRSRLLARRFGHDLPFRDDFRTSAAWAQFRNCRDDTFDDRWVYKFPDGPTVRRDQNTVHLWGDGYWIWLIRLNGDRISVGVSYRRQRPPEEGNAREVFWKILRRYPMLDWLVEEDVLEFGAYKDVQHCTDTFVSPKRYAMVGDASSIIDAFYSQGISLSMVASWHLANIMQSDVATGKLDTGYVRQVNKALTADWRIMRSMVQAKYSGAVADSRFFMLDHTLDLMIFVAAILGRFRASRWLFETGGRTDAETAEHVKIRKGLRNRMYLSQSLPWAFLPPHFVAGAVERWHRGLEKRAMWRLEHGVELPKAKAVMRPNAALPGIWRLRKLDRYPGGDITLPPFREPKRAAISGTEYRPPAMMVNGLIFLVTASIATWRDIVDTRIRKTRMMFRRSG